MENQFKSFIVSKNSKLKLKSIETSYSGDYNKDTAKVELQRCKKEISKQQEKLYADNRFSLLIIFQAMDAAGKDSSIEHVMSGLNPQGCQVYSFKNPNAEEYDHDFLWRNYKALPERGRIGIHNRSHYEYVLACKVHPECIIKENLPGINSIKDIDEKFWLKRYESIKNFENHLTENGTIILKFFLNVSKEKQKERFLERINDPEKNWKFSSGDIAERALWSDYMKAYEMAIDHTSTVQNPWHIIPADKKWFARLAISEIIEAKLKSLNLEFPVLGETEKSKLDACKSSLLNEK